MKTYTIISRRDDGETTVSAPLRDPKHALDTAMRWRSHASGRWDWFIQEATLGEPASGVLISLDRFVVSGSRSMKSKLLR